MKKSEESPYQRKKEIPTDTPLNPGAMFINDEYHPGSSNYKESEEWPRDAHENQNSDEDSTEQTNGPT